MKPCKIIICCTIPLLNLHLHQPQQPSKQQTHGAFNGGRKGKNFIYHQSDFRHKAQGQRGKEYTQVSRQCKIPG